MKHIALIGAALLLAAMPPTSYSHVFGPDYVQAKAFMQQQNQLISSELQADRAVLEAVLFPEAIRYSLLRDLFETSALELLYVQYGSRYADFSIGRFQMKPSFAEAVEQYLAAHPGLMPGLEAQLACPATAQGRSTRIARLKQTQWQLRYARGFYAIVRHRFAGHMPASGSEHVRFVAAAYNRGFLQPAPEIHRWTTVRAFPYGPRYGGTQYAYADVAADYYQHQTSPHTP